MTEECFNCGNVKECIIHTIKVKLGFMNPNVPLCSDCSNHYFLCQGCAYYCHRGDLSERKEQTCSACAKE